jgi:murein DD-endopeptidase MepM/ murein hydrolase activator NlpD
MPAVTSAATLAVIAVSGLNLPRALGSVHSADSLALSSSGTTSTAQKAAEALRLQIRAEQAARASRLQRAVSQASALSAAEARKLAARKAAIAAIKARPKWVLPVIGARLTAGFGDSSGLWSHRHTGQDFACPTGTPVRAIGDGVIIAAGWEGAYGRKIEVRHPDGTVTWYAHLSAFVRTTGAVKAGDVIGRVGSSGNVTGPHLHFEVRPGGGEPIPPLQWMRAHGIDV